MKTSSTVAAVEAILDDEENGYSSAAIASSLCEQLFDGVQLLKKGVQDEACESLFLLACSRPFFPVRSSMEGVTYLLLLALFSQANFTRFYILARSINGRLPSTLNPCSPCSWGKGLLQITEPQNRDPSSGPTNACQRSSNGTRGVGLASLLSALDLQICRLDRRPVLGAKTFAHLYIVEVDDGDRSSGPANCSHIIPDSVGVIVDMGGCCGGATDLQSNKSLTQLECDGAWIVRLREAVGRVVEAGGDAEVIGCW